MIALIDMDCFYCQVEARQDPSLSGLPMAVVQYNAWRGGGIIAVSYEARAHGVTRQMRGDDAKKKCPEIRLVSVPEVREKADLTKYREAGKEVIDVLMTFEGCVVERASIDEAYLDITKVVDRRIRESEAGSQAVCEGDLPNTFVVGSEEDKVGWLKKIEEGGESDSIRLAVGGAVVEEMRKAVFDKTGFRCSAGVAHNKMLSKLVCSFHKPNRQTILPHDRIDELFATLKVTKLRGLGGKLGDAIVEGLRVETVAELAQVPMSNLKQAFDDKTANWLHNIARGLEFEPVRERELPKSIGCSKNFLGPKMLDTREKVQFWFASLAQEVCERLEKDRQANGRTARGINVSVTMDGDRGSVSRAGQLSSYDPDKMARQAMTLVGSLNEAAASADPSLWRPKLRNLSISASKFQEECASTTSIQSFFGAEARAKAEAKKAEEKDFDAAELVPSLEDFDENLLDILPPKARAKVLDRVKALRERSPKADNQSSCSKSCAKPVAKKPENEMEQCEKCSSLVSPFEMPEHLDFHLAQDLQKEINSEDRPAERVTVRTVVVPSKPGKRKGREGAARADQSKRQKNITSFFQTK